MKTFLDAEVLSTRIRELAAEIQQDGWEGSLLVIVVMKGAVVFAADLIRHLPGDLELAFLGVRSYEGAQSTGAVEITHDLHASIAGRDCLVVEDIVDTGLTLDYLLRLLKSRGPKRLRVCTLLDKPARRVTPVEVTYTGFRIPDAFVVGYGLDYDQRFRNLPYIAEFT